MAMAVRERVREVGVLKTLGYQTGTILGMLLCEGVATAVAGGALGLLGARGVNELLRGLPQIFVDMARLRMPAAIVVACLGLAAVIGLASCVAPAYGAARKPITEALRFVD
jgi:putative ABC transport system permease protein